MSESIQFKDAGAFLRQQRKQKGFKTQKGFISALKAVQPNISCSESYISLIEKGVKTPGVRLLDLMAKVLELSASEKGELLLTYKRVPSDFEFAVRDQLKADAQLSRLDKMRDLYLSEPNREHFNHLLKALILEERTDEALDLLKQAPTFENEVLELQERTAKIAIISGNFVFARQAFDLALQNCDQDAARAEILLYKGMAYFHEGLNTDSSQDLQALALYLQALECFESGLALEPDNLLLVDEQARCTYHVGDSLLFLSRKKNVSQSELKKHPFLAAKFQAWFGKKSSAQALDERSQFFFKQSQQAYAMVLARADLSPLPDKAMREAIYFHAYVHGKLKLFTTARVLIHSNLILERNWLTCFMKAGLALMEYETEPSAQDLKQALHYLQEAFHLDTDAVCDLILQEKERELAVLWQKCSKDMEAILKQHEDR